ncbi:sugar transferase [Geminicoccaceae bacterium 1502E]|nr:sugar transferase [Geminicoccaceae bacterium 1502E]
MAFAFKTPIIPSTLRAARMHGLAGRLVEAWGPSGLGSPGVLLLLVLVDALAAQIALQLGVTLDDVLVHGRPPTWELDPDLSLAALLLAGGYYLLDVHRLHGQAPIERFPVRIKATGALFALLVVGQHAAGRELWPDSAVVPAFLLVVVLTLCGERAVQAVLIRLGLWDVPVVVIGAGPTGRQVVRLLQLRPELGLRPVGFFDGGHAVEDGLPPAVCGVPVLGSIADSASYAHRIETAIVTMPAEPHPSLDAVAMQLAFRNIILVPDLHGLQTLGVRTRDFGGLLGLQMRRNLLLRRNRWLKKLTDYLIALPLTVLCVPVIAVLAVWIVAVSPGSPFYSQMRVGKNGRPIRVWKLRTMYPDAEVRLERCLAQDPQARREWDRYCKLARDPRVLPGVGRVLRRTSLDELPQIFNVVRGDMSLVGPRPFPRYHVDRFDGGFQSLRSSVVPGITGLWQVSARSDGDLEVQQELDTYYIRNWSIWIDLYILFQTLGAVVAGRGAR